MQLLIDSANQKYLNSLFVLGVIYHQVKYTKQDFHNAIKYYKDASTLNDQYSKNNIRIIYKYSLNDEIKKNIATSIEYFSEAIKWKNDALSIHNLLNIFIYDATSKDDFFFFSLYDIHKNFVWISINLSENNGKKKIGTNYDHKIFKQKRFWM